MFQSEDPFGVVAVIAYVSCLSLTILLLSAPYFASYFINYYRKLHQIEEAIVRINENREGAKGSSARENPASAEHPPYSAVSVIEHPISKEAVDLLRKKSGEILFGDPSGVSSNDTTENETANDAFSESKRSLKTTEDEDVDKGQLSLLDDMFPMSAGLPEEEKQEELPNIEEEKESAVVLTTIQAYALLDPECDLYIRGKSPFPHPKGIKMERLDVGKYELTLEEIPDSLPISFWMNNKKRCLNSDTVIESGAVNECYPEFQEAF